MDQLLSNSNYNLKNCWDSDTNDSPYTNLHNCPYIDSQDFSELLAENTFSIVSTNVRSIQNKWGEICNFIGETNKTGNIDIFSVQEVWNVPPNCNFKIEGYHPLVYNIRDKLGLNPNAGGGVGLIINEKFEFEIIAMINLK